MRISDWSSDVCSSDLVFIVDPGGVENVNLLSEQVTCSNDGQDRWNNTKLRDSHGPLYLPLEGRLSHAIRKRSPDAPLHRLSGENKEIGRASCRERVFQYG